ncbi:MAG: hypothetical protein R6U28_06000 [Cyclonatronaceae bacterium]
MFSMIQEELKCNRSLPFSKEELKEKMQAQPYAGQDGIRMLFLPPRLTEATVDEFCYVYRQIMDTSYDVAVISEPDRLVSTKKIPILPGQLVRTEFGSLLMEEGLRDDFCDEEDDFFIREEGDCSHLGFFDHASMLKLIQEDIQVLGLQLLEESPTLVQELVFVLKEILPFKNALAVFCCKLDGRHEELFQSVRQVLREQNDTRLLNLIYSGESHIYGAGIFLAGVMTSRKREREIRFFRNKAEAPEQNLLAAHAGFPDR